MSGKELQQLRALLVKQWPPLADLLDESDLELLWKAKFRNIASLQAASEATLLRLPLAQGIVAVLKPATEAPSASALQLADVSRQLHIQQAQIRQLQTAQHTWLNSARTHAHLGEDAFNSNVCSQQHFDSRLPGVNFGVLREIVSRHGVSWELKRIAATEEKDMQNLFNEVFPVLAAPAMMYHDTHAAGFQGNLLKIDGSFCTHSIATPSSLVKFAEYKYLLGPSQSRKECAGQILDRPAKLISDQPERVHWLSLGAGKDLIMLWDVQLSVDKKHVYSPMLPLSFSDINSPGLHAVYRFAQLCSQDAGFVDLPGALQFSLDGGQILTRGASLKVSASGSRVYQAECQGNEYVVKFPAPGQFEREARKMEEIQSNSELKERFVTLKARGKMSDGSQFLVIQPLGQPLGGRNSPWVCVWMTLQLCQTVRELARLNIIHGDISYGNVTMFDDKILLLDLYSMRRMDQIELTGTGSFMSISTLLKQQQTEASEYESCFYILLYLLCRGDIPWKLYPANQLGADARSNLLERRFDVVLDLIDPKAHAVVRSTKEIFFPDGKYDLAGVTYAKLAHALDYQSLI